MREPESNPARLRDSSSIPNHTVTWEVSSATSKQLATLARIAVACGLILLAVRGWHGVRILGSAVHLPFERNVTATLYCLLGFLTTLFFGAGVWLCWMVWNWAATIAAEQPAEGDGSTRTARATIRLFQVTLLTVALLAISDVVAAIHDSLISAQVQQMTREQSNYHFKLGPTGGTYAPGKFGPTGAP